MLIPHVAPFLVSSVFTYHRYLNIIVFSVSRLGLVYLVFPFLLLFDFLKPFDETIEGGQNASLEIMRASFQKSSVVA